jgi:hypothetical protein
MNLVWSVTSYCPRHSSEMRKDCAGYLFHENNPVKTTTIDERAPSKTSTSL